MEWAGAWQFQSTVMVCLNKSGRLLHGQCRHSSKLVSLCHYCVKLKGIFGIASAQLWLLVHGYGPTTRNVWMFICNPSWNGTRQSPMFWELWVIWVLAKNKHQNNSVDVNCEEFMFQTACKLVKMSILQGSACTNFNQKAAQLFVHIVAGNPHFAIPPPW